MDEPSGEEFRKGFNGLPHPKMKVFLRRYAAGGTISQACEESGLERRTVWKWGKDFPEFVAAFEDAKEMAFEVLEKEAKKRASRGRRKLVVQGGKPVLIPVDPMNPGGDKQYLYEYVYSDALLMFLMRGMKPHIYGTGEAPKPGVENSREGYEDLSDMPADSAAEVLDKIDAARREKEAVANKSD